MAGLLYDEQETARRIASVRIAFGLRKSEIADALDVDRSLWTRLESGKSRLTADIAIGIALRYGISLDYLFLGRVDALPAHLSAALTKARTGLKP